MKLLFVFCAGLLVLQTEAALTDCVVQMRGADALKGQEVKVQFTHGTDGPTPPVGPPFGSSAECMPSGHPTNAGRARFDSNGIAEVRLKLEVNSGGVCSPRVSVSACSKKRYATMAYWSYMPDGFDGGNCTKFGCPGGKTKILMWCKTPPGLFLPFEGSNQVVFMRWDPYTNSDVC